MRSFGLGLLSATFTLTSLIDLAGAQERFTAEVQAITPCELYAPNKIRECPQIMIPIQATLALTLLEGKKSRALFIKSDKDGHLDCSLPAGRYRIALRSVNTGSGRFNPRTLKISPAELQVAQNAAPVLLLVSHRLRMSVNRGIAVAATSD